ncbi:hypothetical protein A0H76_1250 [Hepatospora eriocheir]|uniref:Uncharacterized protein n=1 Tax=Hepatospora eriocheir TaxID=1081669 RepID=A0A1X0QHQ3_9MICR|nr:hypothetical protein A0H76_1250 [Hepatospora eriocheir]
MNILLLRIFYNIANILANTDQIIFNYSHSNNLEKELVHELLEILNTARSQSRANHNIPLFTTTNKNKEKKYLVDLDNQDEIDLYRNLQKTVDFTARGINEKLNSYITGIRQDYRRQLREFIINLPDFTNTCFTYLHDRLSEIITPGQADEITKRLRSKESRIIKQALKLLITDLTNIISKILTDTSLEVYDYDLEDYHRNLFTRFENRFSDIIRTFLQSIKTISENLFLIVEEYDLEEDTYEIVKCTIESVLKINLSQFTISLNDLQFNFHKIRRRYLSIFKSNLTDILEDISLSFRKTRNVKKCCDLNQKSAGYFNDDEYELLFENNNSDDMLTKRESLLVNTSSPIDESTLPIDDPSLQEEDLTQIKEEPEIPDEEPEIPDEEPEVPNVDSEIPDEDPEVPDEDSTLKDNSNQTKEFSQLTD